MKKIATKSDAHNFYNGNGKALVICDVSFEGDLELDYPTCSLFELSNVVFTSKVTFRNIQFVLNTGYTIKDVKILSHVTFENCTFQGDINWHGIEIESGKLEFKDCEFFKHCDFNFQTNPYFFTLNRVTFKNHLKIITPEDSLKGNIEIFDSTFESNVTLRLSLDYLVCNYSVFNRNVWFKNCKFNTFILLGVDFYTSANLNKIVILESTRETYRILKHELIKQNNRIDAYHFYKKEMEKFRELLITDGERWWSTERLVLELNRLSNDYSNDWKRGVTFTISFGIIFFVLYFLSLINKAPLLNEPALILGYFIQFIFPAHSFEFMKEFKPCGIGYAFDMIGRIFIGYGYYQTIQAFRKYGKW